MRIVPEATRELVTDLQGATAALIRARRSQVTPVSVLLVEEITVLRDLFTDLINEQPDLHVVAAAHEPRVVLARAAELLPAVILVGISHREQTRLRLIRLLRNTAPHSAIVAMIFRPTDKRLLAFVRAGTDALVLHDTSTNTLLHQIRMTARSRSAAASIPAADAGTVPDRLDFAPGLFSALTTREREVTHLIRDGRCNKDIARQLDLSLHTVKAHVRSILEKLHMHSRLEVAAYAYREREDDDLKGAGAA
jgi:DNA-binding NarL/FixJ family response regulator